MNFRHKMGIGPVLGLFLFSWQAKGQTAAADSSLLSNAVVQAQAVYHEKINERAGVFSGLEYVKTTNPTEHPFFQSVETQKGDLRYDGLNFAGVDMLYDTRADFIVVKYPNSPLYFSLLSARVTEFAIHNHTFKWLMPDTAVVTTPTAGFYDILANYSGTQLVAKRSKVATAFINDKKVVTRYEIKDKLYLIKSNTWYLIDSKKDIAALYPDVKDELKKYLRKNKVKFRKQEKEEYVIKTLEFVSGK